MANIKIYPTEPTYVQRKKVLYYVCEETTDDTHKRNERLRRQAEQNKKQVKRISGSGTVKFFDSVKEAAESSNISYSSVSKCINGKQDTAGGYIFRKGE